MQSLNTDRLMRDLHTVILDTEELVKATAGNTHESLAAVRTRVEKSLRAAKSSLDSVQRRTLAQAKDAAQATDAYVHENPWRSLGIAASVGVLLGLLLNSRR